MTSRDIGSSKCPLLVSACFLHVFMATDALAQSWDFGAVIDGGAIWTDNVFLTAENQEDELVYFLSPEITIIRDSERIDADIRYRPDVYFYETYSDADSVFHTLDGTLTSSIIREKFYLLLRGAQFQSIIDPSIQFPTTNLPISENQIDSTILEARPYWQQSLTYADLLLEFAYVDIDYEDDVFQGNDIKRGRLTLDNAQRGQGVTWGIDAQYLRSSYDVSPPFEYKRAGGTLGYWINASMRLFGSGGAETSLDEITDLSERESFWEFGFQYRPNQRLNVELAGGERFFGNSYRADLSYVLRRGEMTLRYDETPITAAQLLVDRQPLQIEDNIDGILDEPGRTDRFVQKLAEWSLALDLPRSELSIRAMVESREERVDFDGAPFEDERIAGVALRWTWDAGTNTQVVFQADRMRREEDSLDDDITRFLGGVTYNFSERFGIGANVQYSEQVGRSTNEFDYKENQYRLFIRFVI